MCSLSYIRNDVTTIEDGLLESYEVLEINPFHAFFRYETSLRLCTNPVYDNCLL